MPNKVIIASFLLFMLWMAECQTSQQLSSTTTSSDSYDDQLVNETITDAVLMTGELDQLINLLSKATMSDNEKPVFIAPILFVAIVAACIGAASLTLNIRVSVYNIVRNEQKANKDAQERIKADERFKTLLAESEKHTEQMKIMIDTVREIVDKLDDIISTLVKQDLSTKVIEPMGILIDGYDTYMKTLAAQAESEFNITCQKYSPKDIISILKIKANEMYVEQLKQSVKDEGYVTFQKLEDYNLLQFSTLYPVCNTLLYGLPDNDTIAEYIDIVNVTVTSAMEPRIFANDERNAIVWSNSSYEKDQPLDINLILQPGMTNDETATTTYNFMTQNLKSLMEPVTYTNFNYLVLVKPLNMFNIRIFAGDANFNYLNLTYEDRGIVIYGQQTLPEPSEGCDFESSADTSAERLELCRALHDDPVNGVTTFMKKHCKYQTLIYSTGLCFGTAPCPVLSYSGNIVFKTFSAIHICSPVALYIFYS